MSDEGYWVDRWNPYEEEDGQYTEALPDEIEEYIAQLEAKCDPAFMEAVERAEWLLQRLVRFSKMPGPSAQMAGHVKGLTKIAENILSALTAARSQKGEG